MTAAVVPEVVRSQNAVKRSRESPFHIASLDGIRAVAATMVFVGHAGLQFGRVLVPVGFGVTIFFVLSGYLITTLLRLEFASTGRISLKAFYLRRAYRILPPMYLVLALAAVLAVWHWVPSQMTVGGVVAELTNVTNYYVAFAGDAHLIPGTIPYWSLAVEEHFYLLYPLALILCLRRWPTQRRRIAFVLLAGCALVLVWRCVLVYGFGLGESYTYHATDTRLDLLLMGGALAMAWNPALDDGSSRVDQSKVWAVMFGLALAVLGFCVWDEGPQFRETFRYTLQGLSLLVCFYCAVRYAKWPIMRVLNWRWVRWLGVTSYSFYLIHLVVLTLTSSLLGRPSIGQTVAAYVISITFAGVCYHFVERPFARWRRRLHEASSPAKISASNTLRARPSDVIV